jgi:hypothetical protein
VAPDLPPRNWTEGSEEFRIFGRSPGSCASPSSAEMERRLWLATHDEEWKLPNLGPSSLGEAVGWARPDNYPPRNTARKGAPSTRSATCSTSTRSSAAARAIRAGTAPAAARRRSLAILPGASHYDILASPQLVATVEAWPVKL